MTTFFINLDSMELIFPPPLPIPSDEISNFVLSSPSECPGCTIILLPCTDLFILSCKFNEGKEWSRHEVVDDSDDDEEDDPDDEEDDQRFYDGDIVNCNGKLLLNAWGDKFVVLDLCSDQIDQVQKMERREIKVEKILKYETIGVVWGIPYSSHMVTCGQEIYFLSLYKGAYLEGLTINVGVFRFDSQESAWKRVTSIDANRAIFLGNYSTSCFVRADGIRVEGNCIYFLQYRFGGMRYCGFRLDKGIISQKLICANLRNTRQILYFVAMTTTFNSLAEMSTNIPPSIVIADAMAGRINKVAVEDDSPWSELPIEIIELIALRLSWVDRICLPSVCKNWRAISTPISQSKRWPWLLYLPKFTEGQFNCFDPLTGKFYTPPEELESNDDFTYTMRFSKDGWVLISDDECIFAAEIFGEGWEVLPELPTKYGHLCFSSQPTSQDCIVFRISGNRYSDGYRTRIFMWRYGDEEWSDELAFNNGNKFYLGNNNPVFHKGRFYCLGKYGNLGVFDPENKTWTVLDKPAVLSPSLNHETVIHRGRDECYLVESSKGELLSVFDFSDGESVVVMKLDEKKMCWRKVKDLGNETIFISAKTSISITAPVEGTSNRIYFPRWYNNGGGRIEGAYYCLKSNAFCGFDPRYDIEEPVDCAWFMPI